MELFVGIILGGIAGLIIGMIITACITVNGNEESNTLVNESRNALDRAENVVEKYYKTLLKIEQILITDTNNKPMAFGTVASFFLSPTHVPMNFSTADNYTVKDFEKERNKLDPQFVKAVELLKKCGFINVEFTSARR